ncbi:MAG: hypothetical protein CMF82_00325 [Candidatus Marinimicrobia bacterium]|nr:hypothetical protein [Candidatus Neomarinimicrobiota bacterium]|tara:strand:- start:5421 stop:5870 length:450 start_codon:yes stop_codon:yes gene_type:complete
MNKSQKDYIEKYSKENNVEDTTNKIREHKQSKKLREEVEVLVKLRKLHKNNDEEFKTQCEKRCKFLKSAQPKLFDKLVTNFDQLTLQITYKVINLIMKIERGFIDQHEASYEFGLLCKQLYIDPVIQDENVDPEKMDWKQYKKLHMQKQ